MKPFRIGQRVRAHVRINNGRDREGAPYTQIEGVVCEIYNAGQSALVTVYKDDTFPEGIPFSGTYLSEITPLEVLEQSGS